MTEQDEKTIRSFIVILVVVIVLLVGFYFFTKNVVNKKDTTSDNNTEEKSIIDPSIAIVGTMLKKGDGPYYVMLYDFKSSSAAVYENMKNSYKMFNEANTLYTVDLGSAMNSKYVDLNNPNPKANNLEDLKFGNFTVIRVSNNKITDAYTDVDSVKKLWKID